jgi:hypothetical protein
VSESGESGNVSLWIVCSDCKRVLYTGEGDPPPEVRPESERRPCPDCGSIHREGAVAASEIVGLSDIVASPRVIRGLTDTRVTVLFVLLGIAATVGTAAGFAEESVAIGFVWAVGAVVVGTALLTLIYRWPPLRALTMEMMHRITGK